MHCGECFPLQQAIWPVELEKLHSGGTQVRNADNHDAIQFEMVSPSIRARIEQAAQVPCARSEGCNVGALCTIAENTRKGEIRINRLAPVSFTDNVFKLAPEERISS